MSTEKQSSASKFFAFTFGWSWLFWGFAAVSGAVADTTAGGTLLVLGGIAPALAALVLLRRGSPLERFDYRVRLTDPRRIRPLWWIPTLALLPLLAVLAAFLGEAPLAFSLPQPAWRILPAALFLLLFGPLAEEMGWRGFALDRLQRRTNALSASLQLGVVWAAWHLPLFLFEGTWQHGLGFGTEAFWGFMLALPFHAILLTWIYNNTGGSILAAVLMHFSINLAGEWLELTAAAEHTLLLLTAGAAAAVTLLWGPATLARPFWSKRTVTATSP